MLINQAMRNTNVQTSARVLGNTVVSEKFISSCVTLFDEAMQQKAQKVDLLSYMFRKYSWVHAKHSVFVFLHLSGSQEQSCFCCNWRRSEASIYADWELCNFEKREEGSRAPEEGYRCVQSFPPYPQTKYTLTQTRRIPHQYLLVAWAPTSLRPRRHRGMVKAAYKEVRFSQ